MNNETYFLNADEITNAINSFDKDYNISNGSQYSIRKTVNETLSSSVEILVGPVWDDVRSNLKSYSNLLGYSNSINKLINDANRECLKEILLFLEEEPALNTLNTADLPKYEDEKKQIETEIQAAKDRIETLKNVPETITKTITEIGADGKPYTSTIQVPNEPAYSDAQNEIANIYHQIDSILTPKLEYTNKLINKINKFNSKILKKIEGKLKDVELTIDEFAKKAEQQQESINANFLMDIIGITTGVAKAGENIVDAYVSIDSKMVSMEYSVDSYISRLFGFDEKADSIDAIKEYFEHSRAEWIETDHVRDYYNNQFENNDTLTELEEKSDYSHDDEHMEEQIEKARKGTIKAIEYTAGAIGGPAGEAVATGIGFLASVGESAEKGDDTLEVLKNGVIGAAEGNARSGVGASIIEGGTAMFGKKVVDEGSHALEELLFSNPLKESLTSPGNWLQVAGSTIERISNNTNTAANTVGDLSSEFVPDIIAKTAGTYIPGVKVAWDVWDGLSDAGDTNISKTSG